MDTVTLVANPLIIFILRTEYPYIMYAVLRIFTIHDLIYLSVSISHYQRLNLLKLVLYWMEVLRLRAPFLWFNFDLTHTKGRYARAKISVLFHVLMTKKKVHRSKCQVHEKIYPNMAQYWMKFFHVLFFQSMYFWSAMSRLSPSFLLFYSQRINNLVFYNYKYY